MHRLRQALRMRARGCAIRGFDLGSGCPAALRSRLHLQQQQQLLLCSMKCMLMLMIMLMLRWRAACSTADTILVLAARVASSVIACVVANAAWQQLVQQNVVAHHVDLVELFDVLLHGVVRAMHRAAAWR